MDPTLIAEGVLVVLGAVGGVSLGLRRRARRRQLRELEGERLIQLHAEMIELLHDLRATSCADRATLVQVHDSGSIPVIGEPWRGSIVADARTPELHGLDIRGVFQNQRLDEHAIRAVAQICSDRDVWMWTSDLPEGVLREFFELFSIVSERALLLHSERGAVWLLALDWLDASSAELVRHTPDSPLWRQSLARLATLVRTHSDWRQDHRG